MTAKGLSSPPAPLAYSEPDAVRLAIDQCAEVGFEMVIMTFGSGFDIESEDPYTGLAEIAKVRKKEGESKCYKIDRDYNIEIPIEMEARSVSYLVIEPEI